MKNKVNENIGEDHMLTSIDTPLVKDAFVKSDVEKIEIIKDHFEKIMETLGLDLKDDSLAGSPERVAKMYVSEIFSGLNPLNEPKVSLFENSYKYKGMLVEKEHRIVFFVRTSFCSNCWKSSCCIFCK